MLSLRYDCGLYKGLKKERIHLIIYFFLGAAFLAGFLAAGFLAARFLAAGFLAALGFLAAGFLAAMGFLAAGFLAAFLGFLAAGFLALGFFAFGFLAALGSAASLKEPAPFFPAAAAATRALESIIFFMAILTLEAALVASTL